MLFEESEVSFDDRNLFFQDFKKWNNLETLTNELEVIGFYFTDHPLNYYPNQFFQLKKITNFNDINNNMETRSVKLCGAILDIKERSNKDGKKYAFITVSERNAQYELTIFSENLYKYRPTLKEGNLLIFDVDILRKNSDTRFIIKKITSLDIRGVRKKEERQRIIDIVTGLALGKKCKIKQINANGVFLIIPPSE